MLHYPPFAIDGKPTPLTDIISEYDIDFCVFGHIHAVYEKKPVGAYCKIGKTTYILTSADQIGFSPVCFMEVKGEKNSSLNVYEVHPDEDGIEIIKHPLSFAKKIQ
jgi:hypothetical protein